MLCEPMIPIESAYWAKCIFCGADTHYRIARENGVWHQVCELCANSSRTIECAKERFAIIAESFRADERMRIEAFRRSLANGQVTGNKRATDAVGVAEEEVDARERG